jgi:hypothetical protein
MLVSASKHQPRAIVDLKAFNHHHPPFHSKLRHTQRMRLGSDPLSPSARTARFESALGMLRWRLRDFELGERLGGLGWPLAGHHVRFLMPRLIGLSARATPPQAHHMTNSSCGANVSTLERTEYCTQYTVLLYGREVWTQVSVEPACELRGLVSSLPCSLTACEKHSCSKEEGAPLLLIVEFGCSPFGKAGEFSSTGRIWSTAENRQPLDSKTSRRCAQVEPKQKTIRSVRSVHSTYSEAHSTGVSCSSIDARAR